MRFLGFKFRTFSKKRVLEVLQEVKVPQELHQEALDSITEGRNIANSFKCLFCNLSAPLIVPFALLFCKWDSERLPKFFRWYDNDTNLNGDRNLPVSLDREDPVAIESCFYRQGHHPREFLSRYIWIGLRNRGKMSYMQDDYPLVQDQQEWGTNGLTRGSRDENKPAVTGWNVTRNNKTWQMISCFEVKEGYYQETWWGWKLGLSKRLQQLKNNSKTMSVGYSVKVRKGWKG